MEAIDSKPDRPQPHGTRHTKAMVFVGGEIGISPPPNPEAFVVGCDSGYDHAIAKGHTVDLLVGDLDSITPSGLASALASGIEIERHPPDKDATDFEISVDACSLRGITEVAIYGGEGGRVDHLLAIATALTSDKWRSLSLTWHTAHGVTRPITGPTELTIDVTDGANVSLTAVTDCKGVTTRGLAWGLDEETLPRGTSRGMSNIAQSESVTVALDSGSLLITTSTDHPQHDIEETPSP